MELTYKVFSAHVQPTPRRLKLADDSEVTAVVVALNVQLVAPGQGTIALTLPATAENAALFVPGAEIVANLSFRAMET